MGCMLDIELSVRNYRCFGDEPASIRISDGFTALIGVNNSGKSSLLRILYEIRELLSRIRRGSQNSHPTYGFLMGDEAKDVWGSTLLDGERVQRAGVNKPIEISLTVHDGPEGKFAIGEDLLRVVMGFLFDEEGNNRLALLQVRKLDDSVIGGGLIQLEAEGLADPFWAALDTLTKAMYIGPFRNALHIGAQERYYDIATGDAFIQVFDQFKTGGDPRRNEAVYSMTRELSRIFGFGSLEINATPNKKALQVLVDGRSYRLTELGAGLAHFIVVLVNVLVRRPSILLIDEPELNLHASLQLDFLTTLGRYTECGVVFATHSIGLARTAADRIYTLAKPVGEPSRVRYYDSEPDLVTLLGQLSFDGRPELGFSKVLLVEGKTEVRAIMQMLRRYRKEHQVLLLPLHGGEMIRPDVEAELVELLRLGVEVKYLIDSERASENEPIKRTRHGFVELCGKLGIPGLVLRYRALENYFTQSSIDRALGEGFAVLGPYEKKGKGQGWPKTGNWRIAAELSREELDETDLGRFLERL